MFFYVSQSWALPACPDSRPFNNCYGSLVSSTGSEVEGEWQNNKLNGPGRIIYPSGNKYIGNSKIINLMEKELTIGQMETNMKVILKKAKEMGKAL